MITCIINKYRLGRLPGNLVHQSLYQYVIATIGLALCIACVFSPREIGNLSWNSFRLPAPDDVMCPYPTTVYTSRKSLLTRLNKGVGVDIQRSLYLTRMIIWLTRALTATINTYIFLVTNSALVQYVAEYIYACSGTVKWLKPDQLETKMVSCLITTTTFLDTSRIIGNLLISDLILHPVSDDNVNNSLCNGFVIYAIKDVMMEITHMLS